jgi:hypothetical protein
MEKNTPYHRRGLADDEGVVAREKDGLVRHWPWAARTKPDLLQHAAVHEQVVHQNLRQNKI